MIVPTRAARRKLLLVKCIHTVAWAVFATAIVAIPVTTVMDELQWASWLSALVFIEVAVLAANIDHARTTTGRGGAGPVPPRPIRVVLGVTSPGS